MRTEALLCPVVNKLRLTIWRRTPCLMGMSHYGLKGPHRTTYCWHDSKKAKLWGYLQETILTEPDVYGAMVGGWCFLRYSL